MLTQLQAELQRVTQLLNAIVTIQIYSDAVYIVSGRTGIKTVATLEQAYSFLQSIN